MSNPVDEGRIQSALERAANELMVLSTRVRHHGIREYVGDEVGEIAWRLDKLETEIARLAPEETDDD